jgi:hypothetical protein
MDDGWIPWRKRPENRAAARRNYVEQNRNRSYDTPYYSQSDPVPWDQRPENREHASQRNRVRNAEYRKSRETIRYGIQAPRPKPKTCELCFNERRVIVFDHCHSTKVFRGWICVPCNTAIGLMENNPGLLKRIVKYLNPE